MSLMSFTDVDHLTFPEAATPSIRVESWSDAVRILQVRGFTRDGTISHDHTTLGTRARQETSFEVSDIPVSILVKPAAAGVKRGQCYVRLSLLMGGFQVGVLSACYLSDGATIAWPPGRIEGFTDGPGLIRTIVGTDPAAGAEMVETVPSNVLWELRSISIYFAPDATVASRVIRLILDDGTNMFYRETHDAIIAASQAYNIAIAPVGAWHQVQALAHMTIPIPMGIKLPEAGRIQTSTYAIQAGDNFGAPVLQVEEWIQE